MKRRRRVGVIGTFVWDEIHGRDPAQAPLAEWGGITYALAGLDAALSDEWEIVPLIKVGSDLASRARDARSLPTSMSGTISHSSLSAASSPASA